MKRNWRDDDIPLGLSGQGLAGVVPFERRRRWERDEEERQERDRALNELFHGEDLLDEPEPEENDDWVARMRDDRPMNAVCDDVFAACDNTWSQDSVGWRAPRLDGFEGMAAVALRQSRAVQVGHAPARRPEAMLIRSARQERISRRSLLCRSSIVWLAACLMLGAFCFGGAAWFSSVPDRPARAAVPATTRVTYVTKNIEEVRKGETVVAWDPVTGQLGRHEVTNTFERTADHLRVLEFAAADDGQMQTLETTDEHPFWSVEAGDFVAAGDLRPGDRFISPTGEFSTLTATHRDEHPEGVPVYNFEVADVHNYYVRAHGLRGPPVRVHNAQGYGSQPAAGKPPVGSTRHIDLQHAENGGYKIEFESGMGYAGKGGTTRARQSARRHSRENGDPVKKIDHFPADNDSDAFDIEATFLHELGGPRSPRNYNRRGSPGTPF